MTYHIHQLHYRSSTEPVPLRQAIINSSFKISSQASAIAIHDRMASSEYDRRYSLGVASTLPKMVYLHTQSWDALPDQLHCPSLQRGQGVFFPSPAHPPVIIQITAFIMRDQHNIKDREAMPHIPQSAALPCIVHQYAPQTLILRGADWRSARCPIATL